MVCDWLLVNFEFSRQSNSQSETHGTLNSYVIRMEFCQSPNFSSGERITLKKGQCYAVECCLFSLARLISGYWITWTNGWRSIL